MSFISKILGAAKDDITSGLWGAVNHASRGELGEAIDSIVNIPGNVANNAGAHSGTSFGDGFAGINAREDAVQDWCWYAILPSFAGKNCPWYYVTAANTPFRKINPETVKRNGHEVTSADYYSMSGNLNLKFFLDSSSKAADYLRAWQAQILMNKDPTQANNQGVWGLPVNYKKSITIVVTSVDRKELLIFKYLNCWPTDLTSLDLGSGSANPMELSVDFSVEDVDLSIKNANGILDNLSDTAAGMAYSAVSGGLSSLVNTIRGGFSPFDSNANPVSDMPGFYKG